MQTRLKLVIGSSVGLMISFFMPWLQAFGEGASAMKISSLGGSAAGLWIIPLSGVVAILLNFRVGSERQKHGLSFLCAFVALGGIIWALAAAGRLAGGYTFDDLGVGFYLSFASALGLMATLFIGPFDTQVTPDIIDEGNSDDVRPSERLQLSIPILALSVGILAAFFMPWLQLLGQGLSGYQLGSLGSYGNFAWVVPILAGSTIVVSLSGKSARLIGAITGVVPIFALLYAIIRISSEAGPQGSGQIFEVAQHVVSIGAYLTLAFSVGLLICACFREASQPAAPSQGPPSSQPLKPSQDILTNLERLAGLRAQGVLTETEFEEQKKQIIQ